MKKCLTLIFLIGGCSSWHFGPQPDTTVEEINSQICELTWLNENGYSAATDIERQNLEVSAQEYCHPDTGDRDVFGD